MERFLNAFDVHVHERFNYLTCFYDLLHLLLYILCTFSLSCAPSHCCCMATLATSLSGLWTSLEFRRK